MLRKDLSPKPVYEALSKLIRQEWQTKAEGQTDAQGRFSFRGFAGRYEVLVTAAGKTVRTVLDLRAGPKGGPMTCPVSLP